ncbi:MAG: bifunctional ornithine acetyltransferase/N-acetylglutamate synthase [Clostridia bacterium]
MKEISGAVTAPKGFSASGIHCGIRKSKTKKDLALILSATPASAAAVYTCNLVKGAPLVVTKQNLSDGIARAVICNSGNANTCNADGEEIANGVCSLLAQKLAISPSDVIVASTGVIGQPLSLQPFADGMDDLVAHLTDSADDAAEAIMTTDTHAKCVAVEFTVGGKTCRIGGIAKGSGMIHPNMATMLVFLTSDVKISAQMLNKALGEDVKTSFNMVSVDGDTSTNDMLSILANGMAGNEEITCENDDYSEFCKALHFVTVKLCRMIAKDGEGATKLLECKISGALDDKNAKILAKSVITSSLFKAAMFGADANWGRVLCALGYSGAQTNVNKIDVSFVSKVGSIAVCANGAGLPFDEDIAKKILSQDEIIIDIHCKDGDSSAVAWGCDLTYDYVKINGDYRT